MSVFDFLAPKNRVPLAGSSHLRVFLCHASEDKAAVRKLYKALQRDGCSPWLDEESLVAGQKWQDEIPKAVGATDVVLVCLSNHSTAKDGYIQREIALALDEVAKKPNGSIFLIPVLLEKCLIPERLGSWHSVNYFEQDGYKRLLIALSVRAHELTQLRDKRYKDLAAMANARGHYFLSSVSISKCRNCGRYLETAAMNNCPKARAK